MGAVATSPPVSPEALDWLAETIAEDFERSIGLDSCILATAVIVDVLTMAGQTCLPLSVECAVMNAYTFDLVRREVPTDDPAWSTGRARIAAMGYIDPTGELPRVEGLTWRGHLIAIAASPGGEPFMIDATLGQASHPDLGIVAGPLVTQARTLAMGDALGGEFPNGTGVVYTVSHADDLEWLTSPDWQSVARKQLAVGYLPGYLGRMSHAH